jgi:hypothetical protein
VRRLIRAFNRMQSRIHRQMVDRTQSMLAIGHDLRTARAAAAALDDAGIAPQDQADMVHDIDEMMHLLASLQAYVEGEAARFRRAHGSGGHGDDAGRQCLRPGARGGLRRP